MTTTVKKESNPTRESILSYSEATELFQGMCQLVLQIQTMDAGSLLIYKRFVEGLKSKIQDNAEIRFMEGVLSLIKASTKDAMIEMDDFILNSDDTVILESEIGMVKTKNCEEPPKNTGMTVKSEDIGLKLYLTNDVLDNQAVGGQEMATITTTEGQCPIITMDKWGWTDAFPEAYNEEYQIVRPLSAAAKDKWRGEIKKVGGVSCGVIKLNFQKRNAAQIDKANRDLGITKI